MSMGSWRGASLGWSQGVYLHPARLARRPSWLSAGVGGGLMRGLVLALGQWNRRLPTGICHAGRRAGIDF